MISFLHKHTQAPLLSTGYDCMCVLCCSLLMVCVWIIDEFIDLFFFFLYLVNIEFHSWSIKNWHPVITRWNTEKQNWRWTHQTFQSHYGKCTLLYMCIYFMAHGRPIINMGYDCMWVFLYYMIDRRFKISVCVWFCVCKVNHKSDSKITQNNRQPTLCGI